MGLMGALLFGLGIILGAFVVWRFSRRPQKVTVHSSEEFVLRDAEKILIESQYEVLERKRTEMVEVQMWGKKMSEPIVVDLIVEKDHKRHAVVVESGEMSPSGLIPPGIRRRILEAQLVFPSPPVLLVRTQTSEITEVEYQSISREVIRPIVLIGWLAGALCLLFLFVFFYLR